MKKKMILITYLETAIARTLAGEFQGIVTAPIAKSYWQAAGYDFPGQTEVLAKRAGVEQYGMLFVARSPYGTGAGNTEQKASFSQNYPINRHTAYQVDLTMIKPVKGSFH